MRSGFDRRRDSDLGSGRSPGRPPGRRGSAEEAGSLEGCVRSVQSRSHCNSLGIRCLQGSWIQVRTLGIILMRKKLCFESGAKVEPAGWSSQVELKCLKKSDSLKNRSSSFEQITNISKFSKSGNRFVSIFQNSCISDLTHFWSTICLFFVVFGY